MVAMGVGDEDVRHRLAAHGVQERRNMGVIVGAGIEDGDIAAADDVADRAFEGERAGIIGGNRPHAGRHLGRLVGHKIESLVENGRRRSCATRPTLLAQTCSNHVHGAGGARKQREGEGGELTGGRNNKWSPGAGISGAPATSFNTTSETEIATLVMQAVGQVRNMRGNPTDSV